VGAQEAFVADASHQLRTPLTAIRLRIENLGAAAGAAGQADADAAIAEVDRLSRMVDSLLALARAERGDAPVVHVDISQALRERTDAWTDLAAESGVALQSDIAAGLTARMPDGVLEQVVDNLIDNAVEACRDGGAVDVRAVASGPDVLIEVSDDGPGMTDDDKQHAFDRFWRAPTSRPGAGTGLGLPIVRRLVEGAGGTVALGDSDGQSGLRVTVRLPRT
jgi:signal transduction histidine kinase